MNRRSIFAALAAVIAAPFTRSVSAAVTPAPKVRIRRLRKFGHVHSTHFNQLVDAINGDPVTPEDPKKVAEWLAIEDECQRERDAEDALEKSRGLST